VRLIVPRRGGWRAWGAARADFERVLADPGDPAIASAEIASELRRGADYVRVTIALTVLSADVADALAIAWDAFRNAARDDLAGWEVAAAAAQVQPEPPLTGASDHSAALPAHLRARITKPGTGRRMSARGLGCLDAEGGQQPVEVFTARAAGAQMRGDAGIPLLHRTAGGGQLAANGYIGED
jgi:hypothetical protein